MTLHYSSEGRGKSGSEGGKGKNISHSFPTGKEKGGEGGKKIAILKKRGEQMSSSLNVKLSVFWTREGKRKGKRKDRKFQ